jgi:hypothetical protein
LVLVINPLPPRRFVIGGSLRLAKRIKAGSLRVWEDGTALAEDGRLSTYRSDFSGECPYFHFSLEWLAT